MAIKRTRKLLLFIAPIVALILIMKLIGWILDEEAERVVNQLYKRNAQGIISGSESIEIVEKHKHALVMIHGLAETPEVFSEIIEKIHKQDIVDIYAPLLPFHGRNLETLERHDNQTIINFLKEYLLPIEDKYEKLTLVGYSFGGLLLIDAIRNHWIPENSNILLYSPGIYAIINTPFNRLQLYAYSMWREYCNYPMLGCGYPVFGSADKYAREYIQNENSLRFRVVDSTLKVFQMDLRHRDFYSKIPLPFHLVITEDDNRVSYDSIKEHCVSNSNCTLHSFPSGKHTLHHGLYKEEFYKLILDIIEGG